MKTTIVPAQVTTVEDKIAGNLSLSQLLLLSVPVFGGSALYIIFPPTMALTPYKLGLLILLALLSAGLAIRIKGILVLFWAVVIVRYNLHPRYYIFDKNDEHLRDVPGEVADVDATSEVTRSEVPRGVISTEQLSALEVARLEGIITKRRWGLDIRANKRGDLSVVITEGE